MLLTAASIAVAALVCPAHATVLTGATLDRRGEAVELRFRFKGGTPRWHVSVRKRVLRIDFEATRLDIPVRPFFGHERPPVTIVRAFALSGGARLTVETAGGTDYAAMRLADQIVVRLARTGEVANLAGLAPTQAPDDNATARRDRVRRPSRVGKDLRASAAEVTAGLPDRLGLADGRAASRVRSERQLSAVSLRPGARRPLVMIDPGHGGHDPGTTSASGVREKDLALSIARSLRNDLEARGVRTMMTRTSDVFLSLARRTQAANRAGADLFVSIHLNSSPNPDATGVDVYYLNNTTDRATIRLARMENREAASYGTRKAANLDYILSDLRQQYKATEAAYLARTIDVQVAAEIKRGWGLRIEAPGARRGPFYVLVGAHMPAVLVEAGFLSNRIEARRLASPRYQELLARGIAAAVIRYLNKDVQVGNL